MWNAPDHCDEQARAAQKFAHRAQTIATLLGRRLEATIAAYDLSEQRLWTAHRDMADLQRHGRAPTPAAYWSNTAHPRAQRFVSEMLDVIAAEEEELIRAFQQFAFGVAEQSRRAEPSVDGNPLDRFTPRDRDIDLETAIAVARSGADQFIAAAAVGGRINEVGAWWQGKLRRKAVLSVAPRLLVTPIGRFELEVAAAEMRLLGRPPWSLDDRLLSAFEMAHSELRDHLAARNKDLQRRFRAMLEQAGDRGADNGRRRTDRSRPTAPHRTAPTTDAIELG